MKEGYMALCAGAIRFYERIALRAARGRACQFRREGRASDR